MDTLEERITLIKDIKKFALRTLGISQNSSFTKISDLDAFFVVYASKKDCIESVLGRWGNERFEEQEECRQREKELETQGYDTLQMAWEAYGAEDCPITKSMIKSSKTRLTYLVLHENWHIHCTQNRIRLTPKVEEAVGDCFAYQGALLYHDSNPQMKSRVERNFQEWLQFYAFANKYLQQLEKAYGSDISQAPGIFQAARDDARELRAMVTSKEVRQRLALPINNAFFLRVQYYAPKALPVYQALRNIDPREYATNRKVLHKALRNI